tara:strand:- start:8 stop:154 length:147 start_codon:yes stop_codon:yes gene_type:complete
MGPVLDDEVEEEEEEGGFDNRPFSALSSLALCFVTRDTLASSQWPRET